MLAFLPEARLRTARRRSLSSKGPLGLRIANSCRAAFSFFSVRRQNYCNRSVSDQFIRRKLRIVISNVRFNESSCNLHHPFTFAAAGTKPATVICKAAAFKIRLPRAASNSAIAVLSPKPALSLLTSHSTRGPRLHIPPQCGSYDPGSLEVQRRSGIPEHRRWAATNRIPGSSA